MAEKKEVLKCKECESTDIKSTSVRHAEMVGASYPDSHDSLECVCLECGYTWLLCTSTNCKFSKNNSA